MVSSYTPRPPTAKC